MVQKRSYPIVSVFVDEVCSLPSENYDEEQNITDSTLSVSVYPKITPDTREKILDFAHELIKYFTPHLLLHHFQDDVPVLAVYLTISDQNVDINIHGGYYEIFIENIPVLQNTLNEVLILIKTDLNLQHSDIDGILMELDTMSRLDIKCATELKISNDSDIDINGDMDEDLDWTYKRVIRTPYSELYALYLNDENAGEIHLHINKTVNSTIVTTADITEKEKAQLMGFVHETLLETLEEEFETKSTIRFYSEALEDI